MIRQPKDSEATARRFLAEGISFLMIRADGSKAPIESWEQWRDQLPTEEHIEGWFGGSKRRGIGMLCGAVSGNLEVIDLDEPASIQDFERKVKYDLPGILEDLIIVESPKGGRHYIYRCIEPVEGNQKLAMKPYRVNLADLVENLKHPGKWKTKQGEDVVWIDETPHRVKCLIETRGEGGYVVAPGSPPACHKLKRPYLLIQGHYSSIPVLSAEQRGNLLDCARYFNEYTPTVQATEKKERNGDGTRPGDQFSDQAGAAEVAAILESAGWRLGYVSRRGHQQWTRPGKENRDGTSATLFESGVLHVFSSNAAPFEPDQDYSPFDVLAILHFNGNFRAAASALAKLGYGSPRL